MRVLLLFVMLLLSSWVASAQTLPAARTADSLALQPLATAPLDSAAALHRMFADKRNLRTAVVLGTVLVGGISLFVDGLFGSNTRSSLTNLAFQGRIVGTTLVVGTSELLYYHQYGQEKERLALLALERHQLSPDLKRRLKPRYFRATTLLPTPASPIPATTLPANPPPATRPLVAASPAVDTAAALHRLFARRLHNGHVGLGIGAGLLAVSGIAVAVGNENKDLFPFLFGLLGAVASVPVLTRGLVLTVGYSKGREQRVLQVWQQHRLPKRWARRALVPEYTQPPK